MQYTFILFWGYIPFAYVRKLSNKKVHTYMNKSHVMQNSAGFPLIPVYGDDFIMLLPDGNHNLKHSR